MTETVSHESNFVPQIIEYASSVEQLADPATRRDYFEQMTASDFIDMTQRVASLVRTGDSNQLQHFDGGGFDEHHGQIGTEAPDRREKEQLLRETWQTAQTLLHDRRFTDEEALEYAAITVAGGVLYTHPFVDGNGRTTRILSYLIAEGGTSEEVLEDMTTRGWGNPGNWYVTPKEEIVPPSKHIFHGNQPAEIDFPILKYIDNFGTDLNDTATAPFTTYYSGYNDEILRSFIEKFDDEETRAIIDKHSTLDDSGRKVLDGYDFIKGLETSEGAVEYVKGLGGAYREVRADFVRRYLQEMLSTEPIKVTSEIGRQLERMSYSGIPTGSSLLPRDLNVAIHRAFSHMPPHEQSPVIEARGGLRQRAANLIGRMSARKLISRRPS